ncbi:nudix hydrolase 2-like [Cornus florida]|uniref:nudix hydrolase 2-like n=1 Tax=Cornus florida TaxID=4283 RepID=UPI0028991768|nr:nudix hydrolase 2-like [Cornus florida]XP_059659568.1 nudix hydrolase 2-like [Cornus florida]
MSSTSETRSSPSVVIPENEVQHVQLLAGSTDRYEGVTVEMKEPMDPHVFATSLRASISLWRQQGKKSVWIKLPIELSNLIDPAFKEGFWFHHAERTYSMIVYWINPETPNTLPANASHRVGISAFVANNKGKVLVVQEKCGKFGGTGIWKMPTGVVDEGEDISAAAVREVKEEAGIETEFVEVLAFRQSHKSFFSKSDLMFVCMLRPLSFDIQKQDSELEAAQWMSFEEYAAQPFVLKNASFEYVAKICLAKKDKDYAGFSVMPATTGFSAKKSFLYCNNRDLGQ